MPSRETSYIENWLTTLKAEFPDHDIWVVHNYMGPSSWCSRPKGGSCSTVVKYNPRTLREGIKAEIAAQSGSGIPDDAALPPPRREVNMGSPKQHASIAEGLRGQIEIGRYAAGDRLIVDRLSGEFECGKSTILFALQDLEADRVVYRKAVGGNVGYFVSHHVPVRDGSPKITCPSCQQVLNVILTPALNPP